MMMKVVLVDDEYMILRGLPKLIKLSGLALEVVATFQNPLEALQYLTQNKIDILISDMNMLEMQGPEFLQKVKEINSDIELIVLSGYADFAYVKAGIQQGAIDYLRKPVDVDELKETLEVAIKKITKKQLNQTNANLAKGVKLRELLTCQDPNRMEQLIQELGLRPEVPLYILAILNPIPAELLLDHLEKIPEVCGYFLEKSDVLFVFNGPKHRLNQFLHELPLKVSEIYRPVVVSCQINQITQLFVEYPKVINEIARQYFFESSHGLTMLEEGSVTQIMAVIPEFSKLKAEILKLQDIQEFKAWLDFRLTDLKKRHVTVALARQFALLVALVLRERNTQYILNSPEKIAVINKAETVSEIINTLGNVKYDNQTSSAKQKQYSNNVAAALKIIHSEYATSLSLINVAERLHLNSVYLGALFKQETGASFAKYLNEYRISQAIELLQKTEEDINQIANKVGYQNSSYFFRIFKQHTNMSPKEYRETTYALRKGGE